MLRRGPAAQPETTPEPAEHSFEFVFEARRVRAQKGQSVGAALLANGIRTLRVDEAGNAKGLLCGIGYCFECRCVINGEPDRRAGIEGGRGGGGGGGRRGLG